VEVRSPDRKFRAVQVKVTPKQEQVTLTIKVPNPQFWTPDNPVLYNAEIAVYPQRSTRNSELDIVRTLLRH